jgi:hypothetical protein
LVAAPLAAPWLHYVTSLFFSLSLSCRSLVSITEKVALLIENYLVDGKRKEKERRKNPHIKLCHFWSW